MVFDVVAVVLGHMAFDVIIHLTVEPLVSAAEEKDDVPVPDCNVPFTYH